MPFLEGLLLRFCLKPEVVESAVSVPVRKYAGKYFLR